MCVWALQFCLFTTFCSFNSLPHVIIRWCSAECTKKQKYGGYHSVCRCINHLPGCLWNLLFQESSTSATKNPLESVWVWYSITLSSSFLCSFCQSFVLVTAKGAHSVLFPAPVLTQTLTFQHFTVQTEAQITISHYNSHTVRLWIFLFVCHFQASCYKLWHHLLHLRYQDRPEEIETLQLSQIALGSLKHSKKCFVQ